MKLYNNYTTYYLLIMFALMHIGILIFCGFIYYHYIIEAKDYSAYALIVLIFGSLVVFDIVGHKCQGFSRFLVRCKFDECGINCSGFCVRSWNLPWNKICTYGITGFRDYYGIIFFSLDPNEIYINRKEALKLNHQRIVFQVREEIWPELSRFMPDDMKKQLQYSIDSQKNCFCKRKVIN